MYVQLRKSYAGIWPTTMAQHTGDTFGTKKSVDMIKYVVNANLLNIAPLLPPNLQKCFCS